MRVLLDENFPLALLRALREAGHSSEHLITLSLRGVSDVEILRKLSTEEWLFLTQDNDFLRLPPGLKSVVLVSRVPQDLPARTRVRIWMGAIEEYLRLRPAGRLFEIDTQGHLLPAQVERN